MLMRMRYLRMRTILCQSIQLTEVSMNEELITKIIMQQTISRLLLNWTSAPMRDWMDEAIPVLQWMDERLKKEQQASLASPCIDQ